MNNYTRGWEYEKISFIEYFIRTNFIFCGSGRFVAAN